MPSNASGTSGRDKPKLTKEDVLAHVSPQRESSSTKSNNDNAKTKDELKPPKSMILSGVKWDIEYDSERK